MCIVESFSSSRLTKLGDEEHINGKTDLGEGEKPWSDFTPLVCKNNFGEIEDDVNCQSILKCWVYNRGEFAGRTVIPVDADVVGFIRLNEMTLGFHIESFAWRHPEFRRALKFEQASNADDVFRDNKTLYFTCL